MVMPNVDPNNGPPQASPFFSSWRPLVGWISLIALAHKFVVLPLIGTVMVLFFHPVESLPPHVNFQDLILLVTTTVGMGGMRSIEKILGVKK